LSANLRTVKKKRGHQACEGPSGRKQIPYIGWDIAHVDLLFISSLMIFWVQAVARISYIITHSLKLICVQPQKRKIITV
jgi:hypothetical protein